MNNRKSDFSDWLVASDVDGTLNNKLRQLPKVNYEAIKEFTTKGGLFTLASGRNVETMRKNLKNLPPLKAPTVILNGAGVYDYSEEKMVSFQPINPRGLELAKAVQKKFPKVEMEIITPDHAYGVNVGVFAGAMLYFDKALPQQNFKTVGEVPPENWGKLIFLGMPSLVKQVRAYLEAIQNPGVNFMASSISSFEMLDEGVHKGVGVQKIAELYGIPYQHTAAIGDYFNDYEMLKSVSLSACCAQAPKEMHKIAKYEACHCNKGAVADLLKYIMYEYKED